MRIKKAHFPRVQTRISHVVFPGTPQKELDDFRDYWLPIVGTVGFDAWMNHSTEKEGPYNPDFVCAQPYQRMFIRYDGNATPCCFDALKEYKLGNIETNTIKSIWNGPLFQKLRNLHKDGRYNEIKICNKCLIPQL